MTPSNRTSLYRQFADRFRPAESGRRVVPVTHPDIDAAESVIGCKLPTSYRTFVTEVGAGDNDEPDDSNLRVAEIWQPELIVRQVKEQWLAPIPAFLTNGTPIGSDVAWKHLTPFASEQSHGFWFCSRVQWSGPMTRPCSSSITMAATLSGSRMDLTT